MKTRKPLMRGNIYQFYGYPTKIKIEAVCLRGHPQDDGALEGVSVKWLGTNGRGRKSGFYIFKSEQAFWGCHLFSNAYDPVLPSQQTK